MAENDIKFVHQHMEPNGRFSLNALYECSCGRMFVYRRYFESYQKHWIFLRWYHFSAHRDLRSLKRKAKKTANG